MRNADISYEGLYDELDYLEQQGIPMLLDGCQASPLQIVQAYMFQDSGCYMRDYNLDEYGEVEAVEFNWVYSDAQDLRKEKLQ